MAIDADARVFERWLDDVRSERRLVCRCIAARLRTSKCNPADGATDPPSEPVAQRQSREQGVAVDALSPPAGTQSGEHVTVTPHRAHARLARRRGRGALRRSASSVADLCEG